MSVVVALIEGGDIYFGADSGAYGEDGSAEVRRDPKVFVRGPFAFGVVQSPRIAQLVRYVMPMPPAKRRVVDAFEYMVTVLASGVRRTMLDNGFATTDEKDHCDAMPGAILVGFQARLFIIDENFTVAELASSHDAIGSGAMAARAAFLQQDLVIGAARRAKRDPHMPASQRVLDALTVAERSTNIVRRPFVTLTLKGHP